MVEELHSHIQVASPCQLLTGHLKWSCWSPSSGAAIEKPPHHKSAHSCMWSVLGRSYRSHESRWGCGWSWKTGRGMDLVLQYTLRWGQLASFYHCFLQSPNSIIWPHFPLQFHNNPDWNWNLLSKSIVTWKQVCKRCGKLSFQSSSIPVPGKLLLLYAGQGPGQSTVIPVSLKFLKIGCIPFRALGWKGTRPDTSLVTSQP